jgi:hypothetical protein
VSERRSSHSAGCESCGLRGPLVAVAVRSRDDGERRELKLCERCLENENRVWRLRWEPTDVQIPKVV